MNMISSENRSSSAIVSQAYLPHWTSYLQRLQSAYTHWWTRYTMTDVLASTHDTRSLEQGIFRLELTAKEVASSSNTGIPQRVAVTQALAEFSSEHVLLVGKPGSGKSTALARLLLEEATNTITNAGGKIPVLVELRYFHGSIISLIIDFFRRFEVFLSSQDI